MAGLDPALQLLCHSRESGNPTLKPCPHFGTCGGCSLQGLSLDDYRTLKRDAVVTALKRAGLEADVEEPVIVPPRSRRRAVFKIKSLAEGLHIGFHAAKSHTVIDMHHCDVLTPGLFALVGALRQKLEPLFGPSLFTVKRSTRNA